jgi:hypothetical protein
MARFHAQQGDPAKAAEIYRYLMASAPGKANLGAELAEVERQMAELDHDRLAGLFEKWFDLAFGYNRLRKLRTLLKKDLQ